MSEHNQQSVDLNQTVSFTSMAAGNQEDYDLLDRLESEFAAGTADRVLEQLKGLAGSLAGYQVDRLEHSLQSATRAYRDGAEEEMVVAALLHDVGDLLAPENHSEMAAAVLRPYVSDRTYWIVRHHGLFQSYYFAHFRGGDRNARDRYKDHPWYQDAVDFCHRGTNRPSTRPTSRWTWSSSSRWCGGCSPAPRSACPTTGSG